MRTDDGFGGKHAFNAEVLFVAARKTIVLAQLGTQTGGQRVVFGARQIGHADARRIAPATGGSGGHHWNVLGAAMRNQGRLGAAIVDGIEHGIAAWQPLRDVVYGNEIIDFGQLAKWIDCPDTCRHGAHLGLAISALQSVNLPVGVGLGNVIEIDQRQLADTATRQRFGGPGANAADADDANMRRAQARQGACAIEAIDAAETARKVHIDIDIRCHETTHRTKTRGASWHNAGPMEIERPSATSATSAATRLRHLDTRAGSARLPEPSADAQVASRQLCQLIVEEIQKNEGWISFARYMELALYTPGLGYYSGGAQKFGEAGDFITAPEISPLFAQTLATPAAQVMAQSTAQILEVGAGNGLLAAELLLELERRQQLPTRYCILELSGELRARQQATLQQSAAHLLERVSWLDTLPDQFSGLVLANELLDAMPLALVVWHDAATVLERGVALDENQQFCWQDRPASPALQAAAAQLEIIGPFPYVSEISLAAPAWVAAWGQRLSSGALLLIDYGYSRREYYLPQRSAGTLMCHYRHHAHENPLWWPGLNDITAHVDFSATADAGFAAGLEVLGFIPQGQFLLNCGMTELLTRQAEQLDTRSAAYLNLARNVEKLILPHQMGERFKVLALGRGIAHEISGFQRGDRLHTL